MILVFDLGTTYFKFALIGRDGRLVDWREIAPPVRKTPDGLAELDAADFKTTLAEGAATLFRRNPVESAKLRAVAFASQTNSFVLLDADDRPLTPIVLWPDRRAAALTGELEKCRRLPDFSQITGLPTLSSQFMIAKLLWFQRHRPELWNRVHRICLISDYLTFLMTGRHVAEAGAAGMTGLLDVRRRDWWPAMLDHLSIRHGQLSEVVRAGTDLGPLRPGAVVDGLPGDCRFIVGCLDQYAGAIGVGNVRPNMMSETTGTVLATVQCADRLVPNGRGRIFQGPAFRDGLYYRMMTSQVSGRYLEWYRRQLPDRPEFSELTELAAQVKPGADGLTLNTDVELSSVGQVFAGMTPRHTRGHAVRCIMEAVAQTLQQQVETLCNGCPPQEVRSAGGGARSDLWLRIKAEALGMPVRATPCPQPTCLGAAALAEAALGGEDVELIVRRWTRPAVPMHNSSPLEREDYQASGS